jgi:hypothetical protein
MAYVVVVAVVAICAGNLLPPLSAQQQAPAAAGGRAFLPGEQQPQWNISTGTWAIYPEGEGQNLAQTFTPTAAQGLGYLQLPVGCAEGVLLNIKIRDGLSGPILYEVNVVGLPQEINGTFSLIQVYDPAVYGSGIRLRKNRTYAFELAAFPGPYAGANNSCGIAKGPAENSYLGGKGYYSDPTVKLPSFVPIPTGKPSDDQDLPFVTLVR